MVLEGRLRFSDKQMTVVSRSVSMAEEMVSERYKMSANQWLSFRFDVKTQKDLSPGEMARDAYAQVVRYVGRGPDRSLSSAAFDFYKICIQDHVILTTLSENPRLHLFPFLLYVAVHELIHVIRFGRFLKCFETSEKGRGDEEVLVHRQTFSILNGCNVDGLRKVLRFHGCWHGFRE